MKNDKILPIKIPEQSGQSSLEFILDLPDGATMVEKMNMCKERKRFDEREVYKRNYKRLFSITKDTTRAKMLEFDKLNK